MNNEKTESRLIESKRKYFSLLNIIDSNPEKYSMIYNLICRCEACKSGGSCAGPARPLSKEVLEKFNRRRPIGGGPAKFDFNKISIKGE